METSAPVTAEHPPTHAHMPPLIQCFQSSVVTAAVSMEINQTPVGCERMMELLVIIICCNS